MMKVFRSKPIGPRGFSRWRNVKRFKYYACCDCGLVHEYQYKIDGTEIMQRVRRADRYTKAMRAKACR